MQLVSLSVSNRLFRVPHLAPHLLYISLILLQDSAVKNSLRLIMKDCILIWVHFTVLLMVALNLLKQPIHPLQSFSIQLSILFIWVSKSLGYAEEVGVVRQSKWS